MRLMLIFLPFALNAADVLLRDDFASLNPAWKAAKGQWEIDGGALKGVEIATDKHAAVVRRPVAYRDAVIEFRLKLDGAKAAHLSINGNKGHICRVIFDAQGFTLRKDKPNAKSTEAASTLGRQAVALADGRWHRVTVTVRGAKLSAKVDDRPELTGEHPGIDVPKADIGFPVQGAAARFDDLVITGN